MKKANIVTSEYIANFTGHRGINFLNDYDESDEEERRWLSLAISKLMMKTPALKKSKYYINNGSFRHHNNCGSTHPSMPASMPPSFSGFKSQTFLHESCYGSASYDGVSGTDNDEQLLNNSASVFHLWLLEAFSWFQNGSILLVNAELSYSKMNLKTLTFADYCKPSYL